MISKDNRHLWRLGSLLALVVCGFLGIRSLAIPDSFGRDGPYRGEALTEIAHRKVAVPPVSACIKCHEEVGATAAESPHKKVHCRECHGIAAEHARTEKIADLVSLKDRAICAICHSKLVGRPADFPQIDIAAHLEEQEPEEPGSPAVCFECHEPHDPSP